MKKIIVNLSISLVIFLAVGSCMSNGEVKPVLISGTIYNLGVKSNQDTKEFRVTGYNFNHDLLLDDNNSFVDTLKILEKGFYSLRVLGERVSIYLYPGDHLNMTLDMKDFQNTLTFSGSGALVNNYLVQKEQFKKTLNGNFEMLFGLEEASFRAKCDSIEDTLNAFLISKKLPVDFELMETKNNHFDKASNFLNYERYHSMITKDAGFKASGKLLNELDKIDFTNELDYKNSSTMKLLMIRYYSDKLMVSMESTNDYGLALQEIMNVVPSNLVKDQFLMHASSFILGPNERLKENYNFLMASSTNELHKNSYTEKYNDIKHLAAGAPSPIFKYENYTGGTTSLEDLLGKFVYIDVWATWCSPCKAEIPFLKKIIEEFKDKNIAFVSISVDIKEDYNTWRKTIAGLGLGGIQLFADNDRSSAWYHAYKITGIPRFILIDNQGNIISADAPRPSNPALKQKLNELL